MLNEDVERMLNNWALWRVGGGPNGVGYATTDYSLEGRGRRAELAMPVINGEAIDVDNLVERLPFEQRQALHARYLGELLRDAEAVARKAGIRIPASYTVAQVARLLRTSEDTYLRRQAAGRRAVSEGYRALRMRAVVN